MKNIEKIQAMIRIAEKKGVVVDRWNNIKWNTSTGETYRYNIKKNVVRNEKYLSEIKEWVRVNSHNIKSLGIDKWESAMVNVKKMQEEN